MTLPKFVYGMCLVVLMVGAWTLYDGTSWGGLLLRIVICMVVLQVGYFAYILLLLFKDRLSVRDRPASSQTARKDSAPTEERHLPQQ